MQHVTPGTTCEPHERLTAVVGIAATFVSALVLCVAAWLAGADTVRPDGQIRGGGLGYGHGTGGAGGGTGTGTGTHGTGPGAGEKGTGAGSGGNDVMDATGGVGPGAGSPSVASGPPSNAPPAENTPPKFGFTLPDEEPQPVAPPAAPPVVGSGDSHGVEGASGTRGGTEFMGVRTDSRRVVYVIDFSGSMAGQKLVHTKLELRRSIEKLPSNGAFLVVFFDDTALAMPPGSLVNATDANKKAAIEWLRAQERGGGTDPTEALRIALREPRPDTIYLMTDGEFNGAPVENVLSQYNGDHKVVIHTIGFYSQAAEPVLKRIAEDTGGTYTYIPPP